MTKDNPVFTYIVAPLIVALVLTVVGALVELASRGSIARLLGAATTADDPEPLANRSSAVEIPNSKDAKFCALTGAGFAGSQASCHILRDKNTQRWMMRTDGATNGAGCEVTCLR
jgi:hypothetical protein